MKVCTQCDVEKEGCEFPKRTSNKDGLYSWCKECCKKKTKENALKNPEAVKRSREKRKDVALAVAREYKKKHKVRLEAQRKVYYILNKDKLCEKSREYSKKQTEEQKKRRAEYYQIWKNTESAKKYYEQHSKYHRDKYAKQKKASRCVTNAIRDGKLVRGTECVFCLSPDNIEGHHANYEKPLEVMWLCRKCHRSLHKSLKERETNGSKRAKKEDHEPQAKGGSGRDDQEDAQGR